MALVAELVTKLKADTTNFSKGMDAASTRATKFASGIKSLAKVSAVAFAAMSAAAFLVAREINQVTKSMAMMESQARLIGTSVEQYQKMTFMAASAGVEVDRLTMALPKMSMRIAQAANGTGAANEAFKEFGINAKELVNLKPEEQFNRLAKAIASVGNRGDQLRLTWAAFDNESIALLNLFRSDMGKLGDEFDSLGLKISESQGKAVAKLRITQMQAGGMWEGFKQQVVVALAEPFANLLENIKNAVKEMGGFKTVAQDVASILKEAFISTAKVAMKVIALINSARRASLGAQIQYAELSEGSTGSPIMNKFAMLGRFIASGGSIEPEVIGTSQGMPRSEATNNLYKEYHKLTQSVEKVDKVFNKLLNGVDGPLRSFIPSIMEAKDATKELAKTMKESNDSITGMLSGLKASKVSEQLERILGVEMRQLFGGLSRDQIALNKNYAEQVMRANPGMSKDKLNALLPFQEQNKNTTSFDTGVRDLFGAVQRKSVSAQTFGNRLQGLQSEAVGLGPQFTGVIDELRKFGTAAGLIAKEAPKIKLDINVEIDKNGNLYAGLANAPALKAAINDGIEILFNSSASRVSK